MDGRPSRAPASRRAWHRWLAFGGSPALDTAARCLGSALPCNSVPPSACSRGPPLAQDRLHVSAEGTIWLTLRRRWADGTTHLRFDPLELPERLAVLTPRPRVNLILYYGVLAPRAAWRAALVPTAACGIEAAPAERSVEADEAEPRGAQSRPGAYQWADLMRRTFGFDALACPRCGGRLRLVALLEHASVVQRILRHLRLPTEVPEPRPARAPPRRLDATANQFEDAPEFDAAW